MKLRKALVPLLVVVPLVGLLVHDLVSQKQVECSLCVTFEGRRRCAKASGQTREAAMMEAQRSACSMITAGVSEAFACPNVTPEQVACK